MFFHKVHQGSTKGTKLDVDDAFIVPFMLMPLWVINQGAGFGIST